MRCDLKNLIKQNTRKPSMIRWALETVSMQMEELRERQDNGDGDAALTEFLEMWCYREKQFVITRHDTREAPL